MPHAAPMAPQAAANDRRSSSAEPAGAINVLLTQACYSAVRASGHEEAPALGQGFFAEEVVNQWAQPPSFAGEPSVLKDEPQAQLLTAFGLLMAKPEPMSEST